jgi:hypothetical protein
MITNLIAFICGVIGIIGVFTGNFTFIIIGAVADIIDNTLGILFFGQNNLMTMFLALVIGLIVGANIGDIPRALLASLCFENVIIGIFTIPMEIMLLLKKSKLKKKD